MVDIHSTQSIADPSPLNLFPIFGRGNSDIKIKVLPRPSNKIVKDHQPANGPKRVPLPMPTKTAKDLENEKYLTVAEAAIYLKIPENTLRSKLIAEEKFRSSKEEIQYDSTAPSWMNGWTAKKLNLSL